MPEMRAENIPSTLVPGWFHVVIVFGGGCEYRTEPMPLTCANEFCRRINCTVNAADLRKRAEEADERAKRKNNDGMWYETGYAQAMRDIARLAGGEQWTR